MGHLLVLPTFLDEDIMHSSENDHAEQGEIVILSDQTYGPSHQSPSEHMMKRK